MEEMNLVSRVSREDLADAGTKSNFVAIALAVSDHGDGVTVLDERTSFSVFERDGFGATGG